MTPSAARGLLEAILWKPAICWHVERIRVLREIKFTAFRRNEVNTKASPPKAATIRNGGPAPLYFADEDRAQRNTVALSDVDYVVEAHFTMTDRAGPEDNMRKFVETFKRRVEKGQHFHQPYLGCREFVADISSAENAPAPISGSRDLGLMLWDIRFSDDGNTPVFFPAVLTNGVLEVPAEPEALPAARGPIKGGGA
jgi:CRISPR-associated protein Cas5d